MCCMFLRSLWVAIDVSSLRILLLSCSFCLFCSKGWFCVCYGQLFLTLIECPPIVGGAMPAYFGVG